MIGLFRSNYPSSSGPLQLLPLLTLTYLLTFLTVLGPITVVTATNAAGTSYLDKKSKDPNVITLPSGLRYKIQTSGEGTFHPKVDSPCECHYAGTLIDGTEFDSSYKRGKPTTFAPNQVIKGWTEAMQRMVEGDKWELYIPSELAYGIRGSPPAIPPDAALVFTIEMIKIKGGKVPAAAAAAGGGGGGQPVGASTEGGGGSDGLTKKNVMVGALLLLALGVFYVNFMKRSSPNPYTR